MWNVELLRILEEISSDLILLSDLVICAIISRMLCGAAVTEELR